MIVKTCDLPVTREKTVAETSFLCGFRGKGESSNPLTHATVKGWKILYFGKGAEIAFICRNINIKSSPLPEEQCPQVVDFF